MHNIHTERQTKTNATCKHTVPYDISENSALSCPGNPKKVQSTQVSHNRVTQHSTDSNTRPLSTSHWSGVSRDIVFYKHADYTGLSSATAYHWPSLVSHHRSSAVSPSPERRDRTFVGCWLWRCWAAVAPAGVEVAREAASQGSRCKSDSFSI